MPFTKMEWESEGAGLDYAWGYPEDALDVKQLSPGIYLIREANGCGLGGMLAELGWRFCLSLLTLERDTAAPRAPLTGCPPVCRLPEGLISAPQRQWLSEQAPRIFGGTPKSRLYRTLPRPAANRLMREWVLNSLTAPRAARVGFIPRPGGDPAGFVSVKRVSDEIEQIDLLGVHPDWRGNGFGAQLARWAAATGGKRLLQVRTELENTAAVKSYLTAGFTPYRVENLYWYWQTEPDDGRWLEAIVDPEGYR